MTLLALTLHRPWDQSILHGPKDVENRSWPPPKSVLGTTIALHAGQTWSKEGEAFMNGLGFFPKMNEATSPAQAIVGLVKVTQATTIERRQGDLLPVPLLGGAWSFGPWVWYLDEIRALREPVKCRGMQGLWRVSPEIERDVIARDPGPKKETP